MAGQHHADQGAMADAEKEARLLRERPGGRADKTQTEVKHAMPTPRQAQGQAPRWLQPRAAGTAAGGA